MQTDAMRFAHGQLPGALELAFVGDSVYDLYVRSRLVSAGGGHMREVHLAAVRYVNAHAQSEALARVEPLLTEEEAGVVRRGGCARQTRGAAAGGGEADRGAGHLFADGWSRVSMPYVRSSGGEERRGYHGNHNGKRPDGGPSGWTGTAQRNYGASRRPTVDPKRRMGEEALPRERENEAPENLLVGRNPIREALRAGRPLEKLLVMKGDLSGAARDIVRMA